MSRVRSALVRLLWLLPIAGCQSRGFHESGASVGEMNFGSYQAKGGFLNVEREEGRTLVSLRTRDGRLLASRQPLEETPDGLRLIGDEFEPCSDFAVKVLDERSVELTWRPNRSEAACSAPELVASRKAVAGAFSLARVVLGPSIETGAYEGPQAIITVSGNEPVVTVKTAAGEVISTLQPALVLDYGSTLEFPGDEGSPCARFSLQSREPGVVLLALSPDPAVPKCDVPTKFSKLMGEYALRR